MRVNMLNTTLCYIEKENSYLMLHRVKKKNDMSKDKWLGIGGKFEEGESPEECLRREAMEETGLTLDQISYRGIVTFVSDEFGTEYMHLFTSEKFHGDLKECNEGELVWIDKKKIYDLNLWEGDKIFFRLLEEKTGFFSLKLRYEGNRLAEHSVNIY